MTSDPAKQPIPSAMLGDAAAWNVRINYGTPNDADLEAYAAWLAAGPLHRDAMARVKGAIADMAEVGALLRPQLEAKTARPSRRTALVAGATLAACVIIGAGFLMRPAQPYTTKIGEQQIIKLADDSEVQLNTDTQLSVRFDKQARRIRLERGEAVFNVSHDPLRPFIVEADRQSVRAIGTKFVVRIEPDMLLVLVTEGAVDVAARQIGRSGKATVKPTRLAANQGLEHRGDGLATYTLTPNDIERRLAWRRGMLEFDGEPLSKAVHEVERYHDVRFIIEDPLLKDLRLWVYFRAVNLEGFLENLANNSGDLGPLTIERRGRDIHIRRAERAIPE